MTKPWELDQGCLIAYPSILLSSLGQEKKNLTKVDSVTTFKINGGNNLSILTKCLKAFQANLKETKPMLLRIVQE